MQVEMRHSLVRRVPVIRQDAIADVGDTLLARDLRDRAQKGGELGVRSLCREIVDRDVFALRDHDDVGWRLRLNVVKGEDMLVFIYLPTRQLAPQDASEDITA